jgi:hypothetical protein
MSSLLERMVQRTLAPVSGIEPLLQPRYAPQRATGRRSSKMDAIDSLTEASEFSSAESGSATPHSEALSAPPQAANPRAISVSEARISADRTPHGESLPATQVVLQRFGSGNSTAEPLPGRQVDQQRSGSRNPAAEPLPGTQVDQRRPGSPNPAVEPLPGTQVDQQRPGSRNPAAEPSAQSTQHGTGPRDSAQQLVSARLASRLQATSSAGNSADSVASKKSANEQIVKTQRAKAAPVTLLPSENQSYSRQQQGVVPHIDARSEKTRMDVTISIGHIEIRAAQAAEPPRRPAFRPRVSLNDFLNQRNRARE